MFGQGEKKRDKKKGKTKGINPSRTAGENLSEVNPSTEN